MSGIPVWKFEIRPEVPPAEGANYTVTTSFGRQFANSPAACLSIIAEYLFVNMCGDETPTVLEPQEALRRDDHQHEIEESNARLQRQLDIAVAALDEIKNGDDYDAYAMAAKALADIEAAGKGEQP